MELEQSLHNHHNGDLEAAEKGYLELMKDNPDDCKLNFLLGTLYLQAGKPDISSVFLGKSISKNPSDVKAINNLGLAYQSMGKYEDAIRIFISALKVDDKYLSAYNNLGICYQLTGDYDRAIEALKISVDINNNDDESNYNLGAVYHNQGRTEEALKYYLKAAEINPDYVEALYNIGLIKIDKNEINEAKSFLERAFQIMSGSFEIIFNLGFVNEKLGNIDKAVQLYNSALKFNPNSPDANFNLGNIYKNRKDWHEAEKYYLKCLEFNRNEKILNNLGFVQHRMANYESAASSYLEAIKINSSYSDARINYGASLLETGKIEEAVKQYDKVLEKDPDNSSAQFNKAVALLLIGDLIEGWNYYESRFLISPLAGGASKIEKPRFEKPEWKGENLDGKTILVHDEQGAGDSIQFVRFLRLLKDRNAKTIFKCRKQLLNLFKSFDGIDELVELKTPVKSYYDYEISLMSIPRVLNIDISSIPSCSEYLKIDDNLANLCQEELNAEGKIKIGLVWKGNPNHEYDYKRSIALKKFGELTKNKNMVFYSLQLDKPKELDELGIIDLSDKIDTFEATAAVISKLDLVISVDTSIAHLAGALGKETWVLLSSIPDWRWLLNRNDSPWYPSIKLFRQSETGSWDKVFEDVNKELKKFNDDDEHNTVKEYLDKKIKAFQLHVEGELDLAEELYLELINYFSEDEELCYWLASLYKTKKNYADAVNYYEQALLINPDYYEAAEALAPMYEMNGSYKKAVELYEKLLSTSKNNFDLLFKIGGLYGTLFNLDLAEEYLNKAYSIDKNNFDLLNIYGLVLQKNNKLEEALEMLLKAEELSPLTAGIYLNIGNTYLLQKKFDDAVRNFNEAIKLDNNFKKAHISKAIVLLLNEKYKAGWKEYIWGLRKPEGIQKQNSIPIWKPVSGNGETVLVYSEQGAGDIIQFSRYLALIKELDYKIIFECPESLKGLFETSPYIDQVVVSGQTNYGLLDYNFYVPLLGLPGIFNTNSGNIPPCEDIIKLESQPSRNLTDKKLKVGIAWEGNPKNGNDHLRSTKLKNFENLFTEKDIEFYSLQKECGRDIDVVCNKYKNVENLSPKLDSFLTTAEFISKLDLIITVETGIAHLAGTLGKETWTILPFVPDWRWQLDRNDSPWYPSMKLFRQQAPGDWQSVFNSLEKELKSWASKKYEENKNINSKEEINSESKARVRKYLDENKIEDAKNLLIELLRTNKTSDNYFELAYCHHLQNNFPAALENYNKSLELNPKDFNALNNIGILLKDIMRLDDAANSLLLSLKINKNNPVALNNLGIIMDLKGDFQTAIDLFKNAIDLNPNYAEAYLNISNCYDSLGETDKALQCVDKAIELNNNYVDAHFNKSLILLKDGRFEEGLIEYEWRTKKAEYAVRDYGRPVLNTKDLKNKKVLVFDEQGYGDTLNFARYINELKKLGAHVYLECHAALADLMKYCNGVDAVFERGKEDLRNVEHDFQIPLLSLPHFFDTRLKNIPNEVPYLDVDSKKFQYWRGWLSEYEKPKIGLVWEGKKPVYNTHRASDLKQFALLTELHDFQFVSLQVGNVAEQNKELMKDYNILDPSGDIKSFSDTAALIKNLDLVISVDTSVAHLAGALGTDVWTLLSFKADWRWFRGTDKSPWYPTMKLFRQKKYNDWQELLYRIKIQLQKELTQILD